MSDLIERWNVLNGIDSIEAEIEDGYGFQYEKWKEHFAQLPSAEPVRKEDLETIVIRHEEIGYDKGFRDGYAQAVTDGEPVRMKGRWERHYSRPNVYADMYWHCSVCGYKNDDNWANIYHRYCPHCGSEMEVEKHKSEFYFPSDDVDMIGEEDE